MVRTDSAKVRVARGTRWLDKNKPGWWRRVKVRELDMGDECRCVLGQAFERGAREAIESSGYTYVLWELSPPSVASGGDDTAAVYDWATRLGFDRLRANDDYYTDEEHVRRDWDDLADEWRRVIRERRREVRQVKAAS